MTNTDNIDKLSLVDFSVALASAEPVPGGGGVSAYAAALGAALGSMVCALTTGKKKYAATQEELDAIIPELESSRVRFLEGIKEDAESFLPLAKAYSLPEKTEEEKLEKNRLMEGLLLNAANTPLALMRDIARVLSLLDRLSEIGSRLAISDVAVGAAMCRAAMESASFNVFINTKYMNDRERAVELNSEASELLSEAEALSDDIIKAVRDSLT